jgi:Domain of unknown function (DUF4263)
MYKIYEDDFAETAVPAFDSDGKVELYWDHPRYPKRWCARHAPYPYDSEEWTELELFSEHSILDTWSPYNILLLHFGLNKYRSNTSSEEILQLSPEELKALYKSLSSEEHERGHDEFADEFLGMGVFGGEIRVVSLSKDGAYRFIDGSQQIHNILYAVTSEALALKEAVEELEDFMNNSKSKERDFQDFFERNPHLILNDEYRRAYPHITLAREEGSLIPDFFLEPIEQNALCDVLDLKLPNAKIFVLKKSRMRFSAAVMEACAQLREYSHYFDEKKNRELVYRKYGLMAYKPRMIVIIGRRGDADPITIRRIESDLPRLVLRTYDDVLSRAKARLSTMK